MSRKYTTVMSIYIGLMLIGWAWQSYSDDSAMKAGNQQGIPQLELSLRKIDPAAHTILIQLTVTNVGEHRLLLPRLREDVLKQYGIWGGYDLSIRNRAEQGFGYIVLRSPPFTTEEILELKPGEGFIVAINIADAWLLSEASPVKGSDGSYLELRGIDETYTVQVRLNLNTPNIPTKLRGRVWKGKTESNTVSFVLETQTPTEK